MKWQDRAKRFVDRWEDKEHDRGLARRSDPDTSHQSARQTNASRLEGLVLGFLRENGSCTTEQVCAGLKMEWNSISPRFRPLVNKGLIREAGRALASTNRRVIKWKAL